MDVSKLKVADLKKELKSRGLSTSGTKNELTERLQEAMKDESSDNAALETDDLLDEEAVLGGETDETILDESNAQLNSNEDDAALLTPPATTAEQTTGSPKKRETTETQPKKITINRKITIDPPKQEEKEVKGDDKEAGTAVSEEQASEKKVVKIGALSAEERAKLRAQKFGAPIPDNVKKATRAERFGVEADKKSTGKTATQATSEVDQEKLLKRQARFGIVADETDLKKQKRAQRFGTAATGKTPAVDDEKLRKRAERFGLA